MNENFEMHDELTRTVEPEIIKMGAFQRLVALFISPGELMRNVKAYPVILVPFLLALVLGIAGAFPGATVTDMVMQESAHIFAERFPGVMNPFDMSALADEYGDIDVPVEAIMGAAVLVSMIFSAAIMPFVASLIYTVVLFILSKIFKGSATFVQLFSMYMHIYVIYALGMLVMYGLMSLTGSLTDLTSLAAVFAADASFFDPAYSFWLSFGVFPIWSAVLTYIGVKILNDFSAARAGIIAGLVFAGGIAFAVGMAMASYWISFELPAAAMGAGL